MLDQMIPPSPSAVVSVDGGVGLYVIRIAMFEVREGEEVVRGVGRKIDGGAAGKGGRVGSGERFLDGCHEESRR